MDAGVVYWRPSQISVMFETWTWIHYTTGMAKRKSKQRAARVVSGNSHRTFCDNFKSLRLRQGLTQDELARNMQVSRTYIADLERGRNCPSLDVVDRCAKGLSVTPQVLLLAAAKKNVRNPP